MNKLLLVLFTSLTISWATLIPTVCPNSDVYSIIRHQKVLCPPVDPQQGRLWSSEEAFTTELFSILEQIQDFSHIGDQKEILVKFAENLAKDMGIKKVRIITSHRNSGNLVYRVEDRSKNPLFYVKIMQKDPREFFDEILGIYLLDNLKYCKLQGIEILALGKYEDKKSKTFHVMIAESVAPGKLIEDYIHEAIKLKAGSEERKEAFFEIAKIMKIFGKALADFHTKKQTTNQGLHPQYEKSFFTLCQQVTNLLDKYPQKGLTSGDLWHLYQTHLSRLKVKKLNWSFTHGDSNLGNFFFDNDTNEITVIDLPTAKPSIGKDLHPIGIAAEDYTNIIDQLELRKLIGLQKDEVLLLSSGFKKGYEQSVFTIPSLEEIEFFQFVCMLKRLLSTLGNLEVKAIGAKKAGYMVRAETIEWLKKDKEESFAHLNDKTKPFLTIS